ncbi:unnamed protein product [Closterium sp. NIES-53]
MAAAVLRSAPGAGSWSTAFSCPSPYSGPTRGLTERREPESRPVSPVSRAVSPVRTPPPVPGTHSMTKRPSTAPQRVPLPSPPASSLPGGPDLESDSLRAASPTITRFLATAVTDPLFESSASSALVAELVDFAAVCRLDYATSLVAESASASATVHSSAYQSLDLNSTFGRVLHRACDSYLEDGLELSSLVTQTCPGSSCEAEINAGAMSAQELRWLIYLLTDLGEAPRSPPVLTKRIALRYFLAQELQQRGQLRLAYVASQANIADVFTKALSPCDHQRFCTVPDLVPTVPHLLTS